MVYIDVFCGPLSNTTPNVEVQLLYSLSNRVLNKPRILQYYADHAIFKISVEYVELDRTCSCDWSFRSDQNSWQQPWRYQCWHSVVDLVSSTAAMVRWRDCDVSDLGETMKMVTNSSRTPMRSWGLWEVGILERYWNNWQSDCIVVPRARICWTRRTCTVPSKRSSCCKSLCRWPPLRNRSQRYRPQSIRSLCPAHPWTRNPTRGFQELLTLFLRGLSLVERACRVVCSAPKQ